MDDSQWVGVASIAGSTELTRLVLLTCCLGGLQLTWGVEMTYGTPYLLGLGLPKSIVSLVWVAGPLSGLLVQPLVGIFSDNSRSKYGRRRPFMVVGSLVVAFGLMTLAWSSEIASIFTKNEDKQRTGAIITAVLAIYLVDFQASARAIIVDVLPTDQQQMGNAWAARMTGFGHMLGYILGFLDLKVALWFLGSTQMKDLCFISAVALLGCMSITCYYVQERVQLGQASGKRRSALYRAYTSLKKTLLNLPPNIRRICVIQFFSWIGWFPFLFYTSTWVGEIFARNHPDLNEDDLVGRIGRVGSGALVIFSGISLTSSIILPWITLRPKVEEINPPINPAVKTFVPDKVKEWYNKNEHKKPELVTMWVFSHLVFAFATLTTFFVHTVQGATFVIAMCGVSWAITVWAPFSLLAEEILKLQPRRSHHIPLSQTSSEEDEETSFVIEDEEEGILNENINGVEQEGVLEIEHHEGAHRRRKVYNREYSSNLSEMSGGYLGIHNVFIVAPQFLMTVVSSVIFAMLDPGKSPEFTDGRSETKSADSIAVVLRIGGVAAIAAAYLTIRLRKHLHELAN